MTWFQFITWLTSLYLFYYLINFFIDWTKQKDTLPDVTTYELSFIAENKITSVPFVPTPIKETVKVPNHLKKINTLSTGTGGVTLEKIFQLAREEAIIITQPVDFS